MTYTKRKRTFDHRQPKKTGNRADRRKSLQKK